MTFGDLLTRSRGDRGQQEIADKLGVSQPTISSWEAESSYPRKSRLRRIAAVYGVEYARLVDAWIRSGSC